MKIAIVFFDLTTAGGSQRQALSLGRALKKAGHSVVFFVSELNRDYIADLLGDLDVRAVPPSRSFRQLSMTRGTLGTILQKFRRDRMVLSNAKAIAAEMDADFDVVNGHDYETYKVGYFYKKRNPRARFIWMMNEIPFSYMPKRNFFLEMVRGLYNFYKKYAERKYFRAIDAAATLNDFDREWARSTFGLRTEVVASGCDFERFYSPAKKLQSGRPIHLLSVGIFGPHRRFEDTIEAVALLRKSGTAAEAYIVGSYGRRESEYAKFLLKRIDELGVREFVTLRFDPISEDKLCALYGKMDVFVFPTYIGPPRNGYGWGLAAFEAMSAGLPVVLCRTTASVRLLKDGENAIVVDPMRPDQIAARIGELVQHPEVYSRIAANGQKFTKENISWERYAETMGEIYKSVL